MVEKESGYLIDFHAVKSRFCALPVANENPKIIKTHGSESRSQEEAGLHNEPVSYSQVAPL